MNTANIVFTSDLKRAIDSAKFLKPSVKIISNPIFRETEIPIPFSKLLLGLKLHSSIWAVILRFLWFCGYSNGCESLKDAKRRAEKASKFLAANANEHKNVVLVGHGFFNMLIGKELKKMGWKGKKKVNTTHWHATIFFLDA
ncbi:histidine phosphatase family protein [Calidifontibacillus erzurumensis]|uniref:histidine phosphatase family protein n=1 Tax=Calidifontibacillus erzurumensis TaxID=2741433 RepID=UPI002E7A45A7|nr:histidine phosphatase family protein [Calidifontibacillus erzurumensis]